MTEPTCGLDRCFLCRNCIPEWKQIISLRKRTFLIRKGKTLFQLGEEVKGIFFLYSGAVKIHAPWSDGREMILRFASGGDIVGHRSLGDASYSITATALEDTTVCFIDNEFFEVSMKANPHLTYKLMHFYAAELQEAERRMRDLTHREVKGRVAGALLDVWRLFGVNADNFIALTLTRQDIAAYAGTTYETVFKLFAELTAAGVITTSGKDIRIDQPEYLLRLAGR
jgi:CRP-like cAMP-binding protein